MNKFVFVMPSYQNKDWYEKNLTSVLGQTYPHWRAIYTDDASPDGTGKLVEEFLRHFDKGGRFKLWRRTERVGAMANIYEMSHTCDDDEILIHLDGDDWLPDNDTLNRLNKVYGRGNVWITYGQYRSYPDQRIGCAKQIPDNVIANNSFRSYDWCTSHMRTYYAWLFKKVKREDFMYNDKFIEMTSDLWTMFPMLEMAGPNQAFISDVMYIYNYGTPLNDAKVNGGLQTKLEHIVRSKAPYQRIVNR
jgi:glycosyltransferase involved in cell wall biosynthesis